MRVLSPTPYFFHYSRGLCEHSVFVSEGLISTRSDVCSPDCISNALVHKSWMADNQKLSLARPIQAYHDTDEEWSSQLLSHSLHSLSLSGFHCPLRMGVWRTVPHTTVFEHFLSLIALPLELMITNVHKLIFPTPIPYLDFPPAWRKHCNTQKKARKNSDLRQLPTTLS